MEKFNPSEHFIQLPKRKKDPKTGQWVTIDTDYLEVKWRVVWFREEKPNWGIETDAITISDNQAIFKCCIKDESGRVIATGYGSETPKDFSDYIEKAETKAIGRALAYLGYGTQFAPELEEGERIVDSPVERSEPTLTQKQINRAYAIAKSNGITPEQIITWIKATYKKEDLSLLTKAEYDELCAAMQKKSKGESK